MSLTANLQRDEKKKPTPFDPDDFLPEALKSEGYKKKKIEVHTKRAFTLMRKMWCGDREVKQIKLPE